MTQTAPSPAATRTPFAHLPATSRAYVALALVEAVTWAGLLIGMLMEHVLHVTELGVTIFGPIHGIAFMAYGLVTLIVAYQRKWSLWVLLAALIAAVPPFTTVPMELWLRKTGRLDAV